VKDNDLLDILVGTDGRKIRRWKGLIYIVTFHFFPLQVGFTS